ncbi:MULTISPECIES: MFS transporter [unclassified Variovorax]|jgi:MFS family permease|uniref:MFS transporter n=1 Tax=unclassified Variovorax TaxID=663243 RepID=UPI000F7EC4D6|nr:MULTISPECIES: MFS transporter [unclassified Variovorax]RSZ42658.1 MFS transporter [Variovorax sp. 553]RSZ43632.1 MFS transporter [Variovorax sp. 679]
MPSASSSSAALPPPVPTAPTAAWSELFSGRNGWRALALTGGVALHAVNVHIVTTVLPSVVREIGGLDWYAWSTTLFVIGSILGATLSVRLLAVLGPRGACLAALAVFSAGSVGCALAPAMPWMLAGRTVQGLGGGLLAALSYGLIQLVFEQRLWPRAVALVSGMWGVATLCGPAVGGLFAQAGHWRWAFWFLLPVAAAQALLVLVQLRPSMGVKHTRPAAAPRVPALQIGLLAASVLVIAASGLVPDLALQAVGVVLGLAIGFAATRIDSRAPVRVLPSGAYAVSAPLGAIYASVALLLIGSTTEIFVPYFLQLLHGHSPLAAGYLTAAMAGGWSAGSLLSSGRSGAKADAMLRAGPVACTLGLVALALLLPSPGVLGAGAGTLLIAAALAAVGLGVGIGWPHLITRVMSLAPKGEEGLASASITTVQLYGMAVGAAVAGLVANAAGLSVPGGAEGARSAAVWLFAGFALAPVAAAWLAYRVVARRGW